MGHSSSPRDSNRYNDRKVITLARSPVIPKITSTSAGACPTDCAVLVIAVSVPVWKVLPQPFGDDVPDPQRVGDRRE